MLRRRMMAWPFALAVLLTWGHMAHAEAEASSALTNFHIEVTDLDLGDGITSQFTPRYSFSAMSDVDIGGFFIPHNYNYGYLGGSTSIFDSDGNGSASAYTLAGDPYAAGAGPEAHASSSVLQGSERAWAAANLVSPGVTFTITAHTKVVLTAKAEFTANITGPSDSANAYAFLEIRDTDPIFSSSSLSVDSHGARSRSTGDLSVSFVNSSAEDFGVDVTVSTAAFVSTVPEPDVCTMMALGIAAVLLPICGRAARARYFAATPA